MRHSKAQWAEKYWTGQLLELREQFLRVAIGRLRQMAVCSASLLSTMDRHG